MKQNRNKSTMFRLAIIWLAMLLLGSFWLTIRGTSDPVSMAVTPQAPRGGEPIIAVFRLNNPSSQPLVTKYQFYANGQLLKEGVTTIAPESDKAYRYAYKNPLQMGEQVNFVVRTQSERGDYEKVLSTPPYPPQVWSSFVSFATFSTSVMSSMSTMTYYKSTFGSEMGLNAGIILTVVLIILLLFLTLTQPEVEGKEVARLGRLRIRFSTVTSILFIVFMGIVYTRVLMILGA
ncbi:MAG: hypothetical protein HYX87_07420 [Chloroflexi bacterium]|nr:hypothetical protein [Chloroflexota bacterium]